MVVVIADTSPLNYLIQIHCQHLLPALFERVFIPAAVAEELAHPATPAAVRVWLRPLPEWIAVREARLTPDPVLDGLGPGEREAIQLAGEVHADLLLMDEKLGVRLARQRGLNVTGTLGVLVLAARRGLVNMSAAVEQLRATDFRCSHEVFERAQQRAKEKGGS